MNARLARSRSARRAFTVLEVVIASALGSIVLFAALGVMAFMRGADERLTRRYDDVSELSILHGTIRRAMQTLVAAPPPPEGSQEQPPASLEEQEEREARRKANEESARAFAGTNWREKPKARPRFLLEPQIAGQSGDTAPRRLEVVLLDRPAPGPAPNSPSLRGAFELLPDADGLALVWRPIEPAGTPVILARGIADLRWRGLAREQVENRYASKSGAWRDRFAAVIPKEFPKAVRLEITTTRGTQVDWLFEPAITTGPEP